MHAEARGTLENLLNEQLLINQAVKVQSDFGDEMPNEVRTILVQERTEGFLQGVYHFWCIVKEVVG